jgi:anaerobic selenocysteine-containing dehydrogenase
MDDRSSNLEAKATARRVVQRVCPFCEATCGLTIAAEGGSIVSVRGDAEDPFSRGTSVRRLTE